MTDQTQQQTRKPTPDDDIRELYSRVAKLNDRTSALLAPAWGSEVGIIPSDHPLYVAEKPTAVGEEQAAPVDWQAIAKQRERELKNVGEARHRAEQERDEARQHAAAIAAQRDRLRQRMNALADRWDLEGPPPGNRPLTELRAEISCDPFEPDACLVVQPYRADDGTQKWAFRCWGTDTCDGWLGLGHHTEASAQRERDRHVAEEHAPAPDTAATRDQYTQAVAHIESSGPRPAAATQPCTGFPDNCPNPRDVPPLSPYHGGGIHCGCGNQPKEQ